MLLARFFSLFRKRGNITAIRPLDAQLPIGWRPKGYDTRRFSKFASPESTRKHTASLLAFADEFNGDYYVPLVTSEKFVTMTDLERQHKCNGADIAYIRRYQHKRLLDLENHKVKLIEQLRKVEMEKEVLDNEENHD